MNTVPHKTCSKCKQVKPLTEFHKYARGLDGHKPQCKVCSRAYMVAYHKDHAEHNRRKAREWRQNNREHHNTRWRQRNKRRFVAPVDGTRICPACHQAKHVLEFSIERRRPTGLAVYCKKCLYPTVRVAAHKRRALIRASDEHYTVEEWKELCAKYDFRCLACGQQKPLTIDHVIPLSKGGSNGITNIQPLCISCNDSKGTKSIDYRNGSSS